MGYDLRCHMSEVGHYKGSYNRYACERADVELQKLFRMSDSYEMIRSSSVKINQVHKFKLVKANINECYLVCRRLSSQDTPSGEADQNSESSALRQFQMCQMSQKTLFPMYNNTKYQAKWHGKEAKHHYENMSFHLSALRPRRTMDKRAEIELRRLCSHNSRVFRPQQPLLIPRRHPK